MMPSSAPLTSAAYSLLFLLNLGCGGSSPSATPSTVNNPRQEEAEEHRQRQPLPSPDAIAALPEDGGPEFNRLIFEASPYLRQHARNPVDWYPWGEEAFQRAKELDRPIFLSVGYATCHWCHVMEHESFEDDDVAALMNSNFVCVKVDREERPDLDHVYMQITQAMTGRGGWPMTVLLTPDGQPFFAGTYIPKESRGGRMGMLELIPSVAAAWRDNRAGVLADAGRATSWMRDNAGGSPGGDLDAKVLEAAAAQFARTFDPTYKGFGNAPKFPVPHNLLFQLRWSQRTGDGATLRRAEETLQAMRLGGIFDQVGFGFHRYSTDVRWFLPHFEKMLYDQALHIMAYTAAWQITGREDLGDTAREIIAYCLRDLGDAGGGFYSAEDADSEGEEGIFYTWPWDELVAVLGQEEAELFGEVYGATEEGNFIDEASGRGTGRNILHLRRPLGEEAAARGLEPEPFAAHMQALRKKLFVVREQRERPFLDDKVLTDWNGLMIAALARAGAAFDEPSYLAAARRCADFVLNELRDDQGRLHKRWRAGQAGLPATLEDHAFLAWGLLELYQADFDLFWLEQARSVIEVMRTHFHDPEAGGFFLTADDGAQLLVRAKESYDGALPSGNSVAAYALVQLARLSGSTEYEELAAETLRSFAGQVQRAPNAHTQMLMAVDMIAGGGVEIVIAGDPDDARTQALLNVVRGQYLATGVVLLHDPSRVEELRAQSPYAAAMPPIDGVPSAYLCRDFQCEAPLTDPAIFRQHLEAALGPLQAPSQAGGQAGDPTDNQPDDRKEN